MEYTYLGKTGLQVSRLCLGTMNFGQSTSEKEANIILNKAFDEGINFFDTANTYGGKRGEGITEKIIGKWFSQNKARRSQVVLATKVYGFVGTGINDKRLSAFHIRKACEDSLTRLKTDHIDLYQMHHIDRNTPWDEIWQAMDQLIKAGKIIYVGSSNFAGWDIAAACESAFKKNFLGLISEQSKYNLYNRAAEREVIPACQYYGVGIIPWSPLEGGLLGGVLKNTGMKRRNSDEVKNKLEKNKTQIEDWEDFCKEINEEPANVALAWLLNQTGVTAPIIGPRTLTQLNKSFRSLEINFDEAMFKRLDKIFPPAGIAPQYYSW
jgi:aryl-alcohol dehydrogenase-like predicted oxidoreductase